jgi:hypothetical protein
MSFQRWHHQDGRLAHTNQKNLGNVGKNETIKLYLQRKANNVLT